MSTGDYVLAEPHPDKVREGHRIKLVTKAIYAVAVGLALYAVWPVDTVVLPSADPVAVGPEVVAPGAVLRWVRPGTTCFPDGPVLMLQEVRTQLPDGSEWAWPTVGPRFDRHGACVRDNLVTFVLPENFTTAGEFVIQFDFCSNARKFLRQRCVTATSPTYTLEVPRGMAGSHVTGARSPAPTATATGSVG